MSILAKQIVWKCDTCGATVEMELDELADVHSVEAPDGWELAPYEEMRFEAACAECCKKRVMIAKGVAGGRYVIYSVHGSGASQTASGDGAI